MHNKITILILILLVSLSSNGANNEGVTGKILEKERGLRLGDWISTDTTL
jgi:hypothetical protein